MSTYQLSSAAQRDLLAIAEFTLERWGEAQTDKYEAGLLHLLDDLGRAPQMGRSASSIRSGLMRIKYEAHIVFYRKTKHGIWVVRILHGAMDFTRHL